MLALPFADAAFDAVCSHVGPAGVLCNAAGARYLKIMRQMRRHCRPNITARRASSSNARVLFLQGHHGDLDCVALLACAHLS